MIMRFVFAIALCAFPGGLHAQSLVGPTTVVDGDSLNVGSTQVRLFGIDAPEGKQTCNRDGKNWPCGEAAAGQLRSLTNGRVVQCRSQGPDAFGRTIAVCQAGGLELNRTMVASGWATAFQTFSSVYVAEEMRAKAARLGIWDSTFVLPEDYRRLAREHNDPAKPATARRATSSPRAPEVMGRCAIKGNRSRRGHWIYHLPGMPYYDATRAEVIFCTEAQAQAAGYRRAIVR